jgi:glycosyltransferase involved in cell wall biosynthesis
MAYLAWLRRARTVASVLHEERPFDVAYHASYSVYWLPSPVTRLGIPSVWGPVGGAVTTPMPLWRFLGLAGVLGELLDWQSVRIASWLPATRRTWRNVTVALLQNDETSQRLPRELRARSIILNHAMFTPAPRVDSTSRADHLVWISRLEARKGPRLAVMALAETPEEVRLIMIGDGPERSRIERLAERLGVAHRLELRDWVPHDEVLDLMSGAAGMVSTGLREEGGIALAEAMMTGTPVVVLASGGARTLAESATDSSRVILIEPGNASDTARRMGKAMTQLVREPVGNSHPLLDQETARHDLAAAFSKALGRAIAT